MRNISSLCVIHQELYSSSIRDHYGPLTLTFFTHSIIHFRIFTLPQKYHTSKHLFPYYSCYPFCSAILSLMLSSLFNCSNKEVHTLFSLLRFCPSHTLKHTNCLPVFDISSDSLKHSLLLSSIYDTNQCLLLLSAQPKNLSHSSCQRYLHSTYCTIPIFVSFLPVHRSKPKTSPL